jgi:hypothetical protein
MTTTTTAAKPAMTRILADAYARAHSANRHRPDLIPAEARYNAWSALDDALQTDERDAAGASLDEWFGVAPGDRSGTDVAHDRGQWRLVTNNAQDSLHRI